MWCTDYLRTVGPFPCSYERCGLVLLRRVPSPCFGRLVDGPHVLDLCVGRQRAARREDEASPRACRLDQTAAVGEHLVSGAKSRKTGRAPLSTSAATGRRRSSLDSGCSSSSTAPDYAHIMAASLVAMIPVIALFIAFQQFYVQGIATSGLKG